MGSPHCYTGCYRSGALTSNSCFTLQGIQVSCTITSVAAIETVPAVAVEVSWWTWTQTVGRTTNMIHLCIWNPLHMRKKSYPSSKSCIIPSVGVFCWFWLVGWFGWWVFFNFLKNFFNYYFKCGDCFSVLQPPLVPIQQEYVSISWHLDRNQVELFLSLLLQGV